MLTCMKEPWVNQTLTSTPLPLAWLHLRGCTHPWSLSGSSCPTNLHFAFAPSKDHWPSNWPIRVQFTGGRRFTSVQIHELWVLQQHVESIENQEEYLVACYTFMIWRSAFECESCVSRELRWSVPFLSLFTTRDNVKCKCPRFDISEWPLGSWAAALCYRAALRFAYLSWPS